MAWEKRAGKIIRRFALGIAVGGAGLVGGVIAAAPAGACSTGSLLADTASVDRIESASQQDFLARLNDLRRSKGLGALAWNEAVTGPSIAWSQTMSTQTAPGSSRVGWLHHARDTGANDGVTAEQDYVNINSRLVANWQRLAENVGVSGMRQACSMTDLDASADRAVLALHDAFVASSGHYKNMVGDFNQVGIGVHIDSDEMWVTVRFAKGDLPRSTAVTAEAASYIDAVFQLFVKRTASTSEKQYWAGAVQSGNRKALTQTLAVSDAWAGTRVADLYAKILGRTPDASGRAYWLDQIARGFRLEGAAVEFYGSNEYFSRNGSNPSGFVAALYRDLMGRTADGAGLSYWTGFLQRGQLTRSGVAHNFYASIESRRDRVNRLHREIFGTTLAGSGLDAWADRLSGLGDVQLAAELAATNSYWDRAVG